MPRRPPKKWFDDCTSGVRASGGADDPAAVCGAVWSRKSRGAKQSIAKLEGPVTKKKKAHHKKPKRSHAKKSHHGHHAKRHHAKKTHHAKAHHPKRHHAKKTKRRPTELHAWVNEHFGRRARR